MRLMRKLGLLGVLLIGLLAASHVGSPVRAYAAEEENVVRGHADYAYIPAHVDINAHSDADGDDTHGVFKLTEPGLNVVGKVTCLAVVGHRALAGGRIVKSTNPALVGAGFYHFTAAPDHSFTWIFGSPATSCPAWWLSLYGPGLQATSGHYTVRAADEDEDDD